ncbi:helix-turn-helix domain-containing protein [Streptomyces sp. NPDC050844]|uniref:helix-turn-helix domain-containing protein n=1 Tax=Streptomyces sp. NPDC050844 TaxID=3155790 RepID=UPI0033D2B865
MLVAVRERIRTRAAELFASGQGDTQVAKQLRVSVRSVRRWRRTWRDGGDQSSLRSKGPARGRQPAPS